MRSRSGLGMILHGKEWELAMTYPLDSAVIQIQMGDLERRRSGNAGCIPNHREAMVLGCNQNLVGPEVSHRMIPASVAIRQLGGRPSVGKPHELVPETDAERRQPGARELADGCERVAHGGGVTWSVGKKEPVWL